jgi:hypothetical protein
MMSGSAGSMAGSMESVAKTQTNGRPEPLSPERLAELTHPPKYGRLRSGVPRSRRLPRDFASRSA